MQNSQLLNIVADEEIPLVSTLFEQFAQIQFKPGDQITRDDVLDADILLVRSITRVDKKLLKGTSVKFVGISTAGLDHVDREWLDQNQIIWRNAQGSNAQAVAEYVLCSIAALQQYHYLPKNSLRVGIIGVGHVGQRVLNYCHQLQYEVICHDPPKAAFDKNFISSPLSDFTHCDLISIHASLTKEGEHPSFHLVNDKFLEILPKKTVLLNTARGAIVDSNALLNHPSIIACLDVWENEPAINPALLKHATIATTHIAGYSKNAKLNATLILYQLMQEFYNLPPLDKSKIIENNHKKIRLENNSDWQAQLLNYFNPFDDTEIMKTELLKDLSHIGENFYRLRKNYRWREERVQASHSSEGWNP